MQELMDSQVSVYSLLIVIYHYMLYTLKNILVWIFTFTGNDYISSFHGKGKKKAFKLLRNSTAYQEVFKKI